MENHVWGVTAVVLGIALILIGAVYYYDGGTTVYNGPLYGSISLGIAIALLVFSVFDFRRKPSR